MGNWNWDLQELSPFRRIKLSPDTLDWRGRFYSLFYFFSHILLCIICIVWCSCCHTDLHRFTVVWDMDCCCMSSYKYRLRTVAQLILPIKISFKIHQRLKFTILFYFALKKQINFYYSYIAFTYLGHINLFTR